MLSVYSEPWSQVHMHTTSRKMFVKKLEDLWLCMQIKEKKLILPMGEIVGLIGPKGYGHRRQLTDEAHPLILEQISFPEPVISLAIEPDKSDQEKTYRICFTKIVWRRSNLPVKMDHDTNQQLFLEWWTPLGVCRSYEGNEWMWMWVNKWPHRNHSKACCWGRRKVASVNLEVVVNMVTVSLKLEPLGREKVGVCQCC